MSTDYRLNVTYEGHMYQLNLTRTARETASVILSENSYSITVSPENKHVTELFLRQAQLPISISVEAAVKNFTIIAGMEQVEMQTVAKTDEVGLAHLHPDRPSADSRARQAAVESGIIPTALARAGMPLQPTSIEERMRQPW